MVGAAGLRAPQYACRTRAFAAYRRPGILRARFVAGGASSLSFAGVAHPVARPAFGRTAPGAGHTLVQGSIPFGAKHGPCASHVWVAEHHLHRQSVRAQFSIASFFVEDPKRSYFIGLKVGPKERGSSREESHGSLSSKACVRCASMRARGFCPYAPTSIPAFRQLGHCENSVLTLEGCLQDTKNCPQLKSAREDGWTNATSSG